MEQQLKYSVDIVLCIDATGSMGPVISDVKSNAIKFYQDLNSNMEAKGKSIDSLRVKVIVFRDFYVDGEKSYKESSFFTLPAEGLKFSTFINSILADGGGDEPENGLEALASAIQSQWNKTGDKKRQIIVIWTDASAHPLENLRSKPDNYAATVPANLDVLTDLWEGQEFMNSNGKRLIIYSPDSYPWTDIANNWMNTIHFA